MRRPLLHCVVATCVLVSGVDADDSILAHKQSKSAEQEAKSRLVKIRDEIRKLGSHEWAGEYYLGDGLGANVDLVLAPKSGYVFEWHGCLGLYDRNYGAVTSNDGRIRLSFTFPNERKGFQGIAEEFVPIAWGERRYLIPADDVVGFCNEVNDGSEPRAAPYGMYLLRQDDEKREVKGFPEVPEKFTPYLLVQPIEAEIIAVGNYTTRPSLGDWKLKDTQVTLNCGKNKKLLPGMTLYVVKPNDIVQSVEVKQVDEERSEAVMTQIGEDEAAPRVGWQLSTLPRWQQNKPKGEKPAERTGNPGTRQ
jgi:hypothetical protein